MVRAVPFHVRAVVGCVLLLCTAAARADYVCAPTGWALNCVFPAEPKVDDQRTPTPRGDQLAERRYYEVGAERFMLLRMSYPVVPQPEERIKLYVSTIEAFMNSRRGQIVKDEQFPVGAYDGQRLIVAQPADKTHREVRLVLIGDSLYFISAEWPGKVTPSPAAAGFLASVKLLPEFANARLVEDRARWREIKQGAFTLRYDGTRWFRDPQVTEPGVFALLRVDESAEAELIVSPDRYMGGPLEEMVVKRLKETAQSVTVRKRSKKLRGLASVEELFFGVRVENELFENHGYFYTGAEGTVQLRAWAVAEVYPKISGDIDELLTGLVITKGGAR